MGLSVLILNKFFTLFIITCKMQHLSTRSSEMEANGAQRTHLEVCVVVVELVLADR